MTRRPKVPFAIRERVAIAAKECARVLDIPLGGLEKGLQVERTTVFRILRGDPKVNISAVQLQWLADTGNFNGDWLLGADAPKYRKQLISRYFDEPLEDLSIRP